MIISRIDNTSFMDAEAMLHIAAQVFGVESVSLKHINRPFEDDPSLRHFEIHVAPAGSSWLRIEELGNGAWGLNGSDEQNARLAAAIRGALPADSPRLLALTDAAGEYVDLVPGITPEMIRVGWRDISEGGF